mmetsp:Transcript_6301/g.15675  ORF Transcript_6301/g.15675 Transcript_6301/m.15675 type:complete len:222 (+) Transcript_6301:522-1187(+)
MGKSGGPVVASTAEATSVGSGPRTDGRGSKPDRWSTDMWSGFSKATIREAPRRRASSVERPRPWKRSSTTAPTRPSSARHAEGRPDNVSPASGQHARANKREKWRVSTAPCEMCIFMPSTHKTGPLHVASFSAGSATLSKAGGCRSASASSGCASKGAASADDIDNSPGASRREWRGCCGTTASGAHVASVESAAASSASASSVALAFSAAARHALALFPP